MELFEEFLRRLSWEWLVGAAFIALVFNQTGVLQRFFRGRTEAKVSERQQLSEDQEELVQALQLQVKTEHEWRLQEATFYQGQITDLRRVIADGENSVRSLIETARLSERGNARLRHALNNSFQHIQILRREISRLGGRPPSYSGWQDMLGLSGDLDATVRDLFENTKPKD